MARGDRVRLCGGTCAAACTEVLRKRLVDWRMPGERTHPLHLTPPAADDRSERGRPHPSRPSRRLIAQ